MFNFIRTLIGVTGIFQDMKKFFVKVFACVVIAEETARPGKREFIGNDIECRAAVQGANRNSQSVQRGNRRMRRACKSL